MVDKKEYSIVAYILGIISIVMAVFNSPAGIVFGIIGIVFSKKQRTELSIRAKKLNMIGIVLGIIMIIISLILAYYLLPKINNFPNFPA